MRMFETCVNAAWPVHVTKFRLTGLAISTISWDCHNRDVRDYPGNMVYMKDYLSCRSSSLVITRDRRGLAGWRGGGGEEE